VLFPTQIKNDPPCPVSLLFFLFQETGTEGVVTISSKSAISNAAAEDKVRMFVQRDPLKRPLKQTLKTDEDRNVKEANKRDIKKTYNRDMPLKRALKQTLKTD